MTEKHYEDTVELDLELDKLFPETVEEVNMNKNYIGADGIINLAEKSNDEEQLTLELQSMLDELEDEDFSLIDDLEQKGDSTQDLEEPKPLSPLTLDLEEEDDNDDVEPPEGNDWIDTSKIAPFESEKFVCTIVMNGKTGRFHLRTADGYSEQSWVSFDGALVALIANLTLYMGPYKRALNTRKKELGF